MEALRGTDPESASVPDEGLPPIASAVREQEPVPAQRSHDKQSRTRPYAPSHPRRMSVTPAARSIRVTGPSPNTVFARSRMPNKRSNVLVSESDAPRSGARPAAPRPAHKSVPARRRFPGRQLHRHQTTGRRSWPAPCLPPPLLQMAIQSAEPQTRLSQNSLRRIPLLTNSATNC
jgi:hypothetical protein